MGIANAYAFVWIAQYYTDTKYKPVRQIAEASTTGHATNVIAGISIGLESTALPVLVMSTALISSYWLGNSSGKALTHRKVQGHNEAFTGSYMPQMRLPASAAWSH